MHNAKRLVVQLSPGWVGDAIVSLYNTSLYKQRHSAAYGRWRQYFKDHRTASGEALEAEQQRRLREFLAFCKSKSRYYENVLASINPETLTVDDLKDVAVLEKSTLLENVDEISTVDRREAIVSVTGGTTGNSMKVFYCPEDMQERFAYVDEFRARLGYELGKRIVWSTGKELLSDFDELWGRYHKHDFVNNVRFLSTFHLSGATFPNYWKALEKFKPEYLLGFPSFYLDLCTHAVKRGLKLDGVKAFFPTAETVTENHRALIRNIFDCEIVDQYASSEGAPFIVQCANGKYHIQPHTGVFEVVDEDLQPRTSGELLVTSFSTRGTPLIRYRIGDSITLDQTGLACSCGFGGAIVASIDGRKDDFLITPDGARISSANMSNSSKGVAGIRRFQISQDSRDGIDVVVEADGTFDSRQEANFIAAIRDRIGSQMSVSLKRVGEIPREKSGKFRMVKRTYGNSS